MEHELIDHDRLTALLAAPLSSEEPVVSIYIPTGGTTPERKLVAKNLVKQGEDAIKKDTGWDEERRKRASSALERAHRAVDDALGRGHPRGTFVAFAWADKTETFRVPFPIKERVVVDRTPYTSPLQMVLEQYEHYGVVLADHSHGRLFTYFMGRLDELEPIHDTTTRRLKRAGFQGLEQTRVNHHQDYALHRHVQQIADRLFAIHKRRAFDKIVVSGHSDTLAKLEKALHPYLQRKIVSREHWSHDSAKDEVRKHIQEVEKKVETEKEKKLIALVRDHVCGDLMATTGFDETLRALYYGKVATLVVEDASPRRGRECPECRFLFPREQDAKETTPTLIPCPLCNRPTRSVPDIIDEAVELAILSGAKVEHIVYAKDELASLGGISSILRFL